MQKTRKPITAILLSIGTFITVVFVTLSFAEVREKKESKNERALSVIREVESNIDVIAALIGCAKKAGTPAGGNREYDSNGDGRIDNHDMTCNEIAATGPIKSFIKSQRKVKSPYYPNDSMFVLDTGGTYKGQIALKPIPADNASIQRIDLIARDGYGKIIYKKNITEYTSMD